jgi:hypothetical protein
MGQGFTQGKAAHVSPWGRGWPRRAGESGFWVTAVLLLSAGAASAASLVLPHDGYGNKEGCAFLATGSIDSDALQYLTSDALSTYGSGCHIVDVHADAAGNQRAEGICGYEGEEALGAEDFIVAAPLSTGTIRIFTAAGDVWGELEPCL